MANKSTFQGTYNSPTVGEFKDNTTKDIYPVNMRHLVDSIVTNNPFTDDDSYTWASPPVSATGTTNISATASPAVSSYTHGQVFKLKAASNAAGNLSLSMNSIGFKNLYKTPNSRASIGDWVADTTYVVMYDSTMDAAAGAFLMLSGGSDFQDRTSVSTSGSSIVFDMQLRKKRLFYGSASFSAAKDIVITNQANGIEFDFIFLITDVAAVLTFESNVYMSDIRWSIADKEWTPDTVGNFTGHAISDGTSWFLTISSNVFE